jgi:GNAT superfamily N-acetyltransferase
MIKGLKIVKAQKDELDKVISFYERCGYTGGAKQKDDVVIAKVDEKIIGAGRVCYEEGIVVLRGLYIGEEFQRRGVGKAILKELDKIIGDREAYILPYKYLGPLYSKIGFKEIELEEAPLFLQERRLKYIKMGNTGMIMRRVAR